MAQIPSDPRRRDSNAFERRDTFKSSKSQDVSAPPNNGKLSSKLRSPTSTSPSTEPNALQNGSQTYSEGRRPSGVDPLTQHILQRTNTATGAQKLRVQVEPTGIPSQGTAGSEGFEGKNGPAMARVGTGGIEKGDKKKGGSFLSRFMATKKKGGLDGVTDDGSDPGDAARPEGMDAQLFRHTVDNMGFRPKFPQPPAYIKVRTKFKKEKQFDRMFLAQELRSSNDKTQVPAPGANPAPQSGSAASHNPIWATEFSKDGKYLAAGGQDRIVRVWSVISTAEERRAHEKDESEPVAPGDEGSRLSAPVFQQKPVREYHGHTATILDLSWSKNNFLLSSSMDKTVRLWHITRQENLCTFKHTDFVPSIQFHPRDDRFFLAGSLDTKLRLWSIPDKSVAFWTQVPDMITAVSFTPDGKTCIAGTLSGLCMFYETEGLKYQTQIHVKSTRGQNAKGSKITGIQTTHWPPGSSSGETKLVVTSNDSRIRLYNLRDKSLEMKFKGHENNCSQIRASLSSTGHIVCGSEDRRAYIWSTSVSDAEKRAPQQRPVEMFEAHSSISTCAIMAPLKTKLLLARSEDPIYDLCNPPPITLVSKAESIISSRAPTEHGEFASSALNTPAPSIAASKRHTVDPTPQYLARSAHVGGNIIVTADYTGAIKVFRQDCAYSKRLKLSENWDAGSVFSKRPSSRFGFGTGRPSSIVSSRRRRDSVSTQHTQPPDDRIMSWRQDIASGGGGFDGGGGAGRGIGRSKSPMKIVRNARGSAGSDEVSLAGRAAAKERVDESRRKSIPTANSGHQTLHPTDPNRTGSAPSANLRHQRTRDTGLEIFHTPDHELEQPSLFDHDNHHNSSFSPYASRPTTSQSHPQTHTHSAHYSTSGNDHDDPESEADVQVRCQHCGGEEFKVRLVRVRPREDERRVVVCGRCGCGVD